MWLLQGKKRVRYAAAWTLGASISSSHSSLRAGKLTSSRLVAPLRRMQSTHSASSLSFVFRGLCATKLTLPYLAPPPPPSLPRLPLSLSPSYLPPSPSCSELAVVSGMAAAYSLGASYPEELEEDEFALLCFRLYLLLDHKTWYKKGSNRK
mgnify:CR=1 FL=1